MKKYFISYYTMDGDDDEIVVQAENEEAAKKLLMNSDPNVCEIQSIEEI